MTTVLSSPKHLVRAAKAMREVVRSELRLKKADVPQIEDTLLRRRCFMRYYLEDGNPKDVVGKFQRLGFVGGVEDVAGEPVVRLTKVVTWKSMDYTARVVIIPCSRKVSISTTAAIQSALV
jgi:hypothetical protein